MSATRQLLRATGTAAGRTAPHVNRAVQRGRRLSLIARAQAAAKLAGATLELDLADDLVLGRDIRITLEPGTANLLRIGRGSRIEDRVLVMLKGGTIEAGERTELRRDVILNVAGRLVLEGDNAVSWGCIIHCSNDVRLEPMAGIAEQSTIADSSHFFTTPEEHFWHNVRTGSVRIGSNTWVCPKSTLARGADVGAHCIVGCNSVVSGVVPDGPLASGVPAVVRPLPLPWRA